MSRIVKVALYVLCVTGLIVFGSLTSRAYRDAGKSADRNKERLNRLSSVESTNVAPATNAAPSTNSAESATNVAAAITNAAADTATNAADAGVTNATTNAVAAASSSNAVAKSQDTAEPPEFSGASARSYTRMVSYGLLTLLSMIGLAILIGYDVSHFVAHRAEEMLFSNEGQPVDPEYEKAEQLWADAKYLEAVRAMREYLDKNPREQYVALRIAEIYEENLNNPLAAALEYEEVLKKKLPAERWGWAAIHLANIYSGKLSQPKKAIDLLRRIDAEYGQTAAAKKARERLLQIDPDFVPSAPAVSAASEVEHEPEASAPSSSQSNLPPGFRPKE